MLARDNQTLKRTPLHDLHVALGAKMVPFAGYEMPVQYAAGVLKEHLHTRQKAGLFDVSHMGQLFLRANSGAPDRARSTICPICETSNRPADLRAWRCSFSTPAVYCTGIS